MLLEGTWLLSHPQTPRGRAVPPAWHCSCGTALLWLGPQLHTQGHRWDMAQSSSVFVQPEGPGDRQSSGCPLCHHGFG